jgi:hypothetical protein
MHNFVNSVSGLFFQYSCLSYCFLWPLTDVNIWNLCAGGNSLQNKIRYPPQHYFMSACLSNPYLRRVSECKTWCRENISPTKLKAFLCSHTIFLLHMQFYHRLWRLTLALSAGRMRNVTSSTHISAANLCQYSLFQRICWYRMGSFLSCINISMSEVGDKVKSSLRLIKHHV